MSSSKRRASKKGYRTPYRATSRTFTKSLINSKTKDGAPRLSIIKSGSVTQDFFEQTIQNARIYSRENKNIILDYYVIIVGTNELGQERRAIPFTKRDLFMRQPDDETWDEIEAYLKRPLASIQQFNPRFLQIIFILDKQKKTESFGSKQLRSYKQKIGREEAARERELQAKEKREYDIRKKRAALKVLREKGIIQPAKKKKRFIK